MSSNVLDVNMPDKIFSCINCYTEGPLNFFSASQCKNVL